MSEIQKFFEGLPSEDKEEADIFDQKSIIEKDNDKEEIEAPVPGKGEEKGKEDVEDEKIKDDDGHDDHPKKNRRHRRLEERLQKERETNIALNARIEELSKLNKPKSDNIDDTPEEWIQLLGDTPEARRIWKLQNKIFEEKVGKVREETIREIEEKNARALAQQKEFESYIDSELENIEDEFDVDLTSNSPAARKARKDFLELVENLSPKNESGVLTGYADFKTTFSLYQQTRDAAKSSQTSQRQKELASRSMQQPGQPITPEKKPTPGFRGWMKDFNL